MVLPFSLFDFAPTQIYEQSFCQTQELPPPQDGEACSYTIQMALRAKDSLPMLSLPTY